MKTRASFFISLLLLAFSACQRLPMPAEAFFQQDGIVPDSFAADFPDFPFVVVTAHDTAAFASLQKEQDALHSWRYDIEGIYCSAETGKPLFASFTTRQYRVHHFYDKDFGNLFGRIQACLPQYQVRIVRSDKQTNHLLIEATNDRTPASYYSYDADSNFVSLLHAPSQARLYKRLARTYPVTFPASDGQEIDAYLTLPHHQTPEEAHHLPTVVLRHSTSTQRHFWEYSPEAQFYASRGCAVFQINARGSSGYGNEFLSASSLREKDIEDGIAWLQSKGIAASQKIAFHNLDETKAGDIAQRISLCEKTLQSVK